MNRILFVIAFVALSIIGNAQAQDALLSGFKNPQPSAKARTWWHWIDGNITKQGITADLEAMKRVGIQEAQIFNVGQGYPEGPAAYLTPQWLELFKFAVSEAKRLGMDIGFHNGPGWSSSGGPWVTPENAMQTVVYSETKITGGQPFNQKLPQPPTKFNYYKDIAVLAFPTPESNQRIDGLAVKSLSGSTFLTHLDPSDKVVDKAAIIDNAKIINLTSKMSPDGTLNWTAPAGNWTIMRMGHTPNGTENHPAGLGGRGLEEDKLSRSAMDAYWAGGIKPIMDKLGPLVGSTLNNCLIDSYEVGCDNWTENFREEFKKRRHYDCLYFLPTLAGYYVQSGEVSERFLWDFRKSIGDLMADNYFGYFAELCHKHGMKFSVEPYGGPYASMQAGAAGDVVMGEFWLANNSYAESTKLAASISHLKGNRYVGAESFTSIGGWMNHPATMKSLGDDMWTEGINRFIFHTYAHQPWNIGPGMTFHQYGMEMNRLNTWWEQSRAYMDYIKRSQFLLQQGHSTADVLVFSDESSPNDAILRADIKALGYDYDQIGPDQLPRLTAKNGIIYAQNGLSYRLLVLPETTWATPQLLTQLKELVAGGAVIVGPKPVKSPSLQGYPACDKAVAQLADELWPDKISTNTSVTGALSNQHLAPDFSGGTTGSDLHFIHRTVGDDDIYFVANPKAESRNEVCRFRVNGKKPELWNPETGKTEDILVWRKSADNTTEIPITLNTNGSVFVIFRGAKPASAYHLTDAKITLDHPHLKPLPDLKIIKAEYGTFLPEGTIDVTDLLTTKLTNDGLHVSANNALFSDPAPGSVKELRVEYQLGGKRQVLSVLENEVADIKFNNQEFKLTRALYGKFTRDFKGVPPKYPVFDVTTEVNKLITSNTLIFPVTDKLFDVAPLADSIKRELRLDYSTAGEARHVAVPTNNVVHLEQDGPQPRIIKENGTATWVTPYPGKIIYTKTSGSVKTVRVKAVARPIELSGPWEVTFPEKSGNPIKTEFDKLISWSLSATEDIKYFSGTAIYKKQFTLPADVMRKDNSLALDLGSVGVIAEVIVNGKNLGILWKVPFRIDLGNAVHAGKNNIEIRVTNLWINRLIGDAHYPDDVKWSGVLPAEWPDWLYGKGTRNSKRTTFTGYRHWDENSALQPSGLMGPVIIRSYQHIKLTK
ncbi:MAG TPA: glycosyl hydrolase [Mucilaginibacter sp.]|jgi:Glycosyl hydrolases family 2, sugar binding domain.